VIDTSFSISLRRILNFKEPDAASIIINDVVNYERERAGIINIKEIKPAYPRFTITSTDAEKSNAECGENVDDSFPQAKHFFIDLKRLCEKSASRLTSSAGGKEYGNRLDIPALGPTQQPLDLLAQGGMDLERESPNGRRVH
jgi:hypothetical protein